MTAIEFPPKPPELASRIIGDTAENVAFPIEAVASDVANELRDNDERDSLIRAEELARPHVDDLWLDEDLNGAYTQALAAVRDAYLAQAELVEHVREDLTERGHDSWIASALAHQFASRAAWEALERLGELTAFSDEALCASCGASLADPTGET